MPPYKKKDKDTANIISSKNWPTEQLLPQYHSRGQWHPDDGISLIHRRMPSKGRHLKQRKSSSTKVVPGLQHLKQIFITNSLDHMCPRLSLQPGRSEPHNVSCTFLFQLWGPAGGHQPSLPAVPEVLTVGTQWCGDVVCTQIFTPPNAFRIWPWSWHEEKTILQTKVWLSEHASMSSVQMQMLGTHWRQKQVSKWP